MNGIKRQTECVNKIINNIHNDNYKYKANELKVFIKNKDKLFYEKLESLL